MLEIKNVSKRFNVTGDTNDEIHALKNVSFTVNDGDFVTMIGTNGSGKSTTMNILMGLIKQDSGNIILNGKDISSMKDYERSKHFSCVFQDPKVGTAGNMSVIENLEIANRRGKKASHFKWGFKKENLERFKKELSEFDLDIESRMYKKVGLMSGGQRQALSLLMATLQKPEVLLLDEHTAALDPKTAKKVLELTEKVINENKLTAIMITHNMFDALKYGNRLIMMANGNIILDVKGEEKNKLTVNDLYDLFQTYM